jgi:RND family efflux transporter MFP subunit
MSLSGRRWAGLVAVLTPVLLSGCGPKQAGAVAPPPTQVTVSQPIQQQVSDFVEFTGNVQGLSSVDLRARIKGTLNKIDYVEGALVKQGDLLFEIEPDVYQAQVDAAQAELDAAKAELEKSKADLGIKQEMAAGNAASKLDVIQAQAAVDVSSASVELKTANLEQANINMGYTKVFAPVTGRIDKSRLDAGNLVGSDGDTLLANIQQANQVYVYFNVDEATMQRFQARLRAKGIVDNGTNPKSSMTLALGDSSEFAYKGTIDYIDNKVDPATGTITVRGILNNPDSALVPGFFARVRVPDGDPHQAVLIPDRAIAVDQGQSYVLVVNDQNVVEFRPIELGSLHGQLREVTKGLTPDDWIITEGLLRTRPGATVAPDKKPVPGGDKDQSVPTTAASQPQS